MIYIALVDDWEIRGNGTGDVKTLQYDPAISLMNLYDEYGIKNTFYVETNFCSVFPFKNYFFFF